MARLPPVMTQNIQIGPCSERDVTGHEAIALQPSEVFAKMMPAVDHRFIDESLKA
jgi:hypothetical protein